jgi:hypothetical protein
MEFLCRNLFVEYKIRTWQPCDKFYLTVGLMAMANEPVELGMQNLVCRYISTSCI